MSRAGPIVTGLVVVLEHPRTWPLGLAAFLVRGGIVLFLLPIVVLPTPTGVGNAIGPDLAAIVFGGPSTRLILIALGAVGAFIVWLIGGGLAAAAAELELIRAALEADDRPVPPARTPVAAKALLARTICHVPFALVAAIGTIRLVSATYTELIRPGDLAVPVVVRVAAAVPDVLLALLLSWLVGQLVGAVAARRLVIAGGSPLRAVAWTLGRIVRRPVATLSAFIVPLLASLAVLTPMLIGASIAWHATSRLLRAGADPAAVVAGMLLFIAVWSSGLLFAGLAAAWRSATMTLELARERTGYPDVRGMSV